ncbi:hypothetical protein Q8A73_024339, partial [Channa argus]
EGCWNCGNFGHIARDCKNVTFLCDSGADKTVLRESVPGLKASNQIIYVKSANGLVNQHHISKPIWFKDQNTGESIQASVVICPDCPVNLLGRDLLSKLKISIVPTTLGMIALGKGEAVDTLAMQGTGEPYYYWTLDLPTPDPTKTGQQLLEKLSQQQEG